MISTHILDTSLGTPAAGVDVLLQFKEKANWKNVSQGITNSDGRFVFDCPTPTGQYQIVFGIESYQKKKHPDTFFLDACVAFKLENEGMKYHVPLLLNPYGYSTYKGS